MAWLSRLVPWLRRGRAEREIRKELELHLALETRQNRERGMPPGEAARAVRAALGNAALIAEDARAVRGWAWLDALAQDVRLALPLMGRAPGFTTLCVLVLAFGIGVSPHSRPACCPACAPPPASPRGCSAASGAAVARNHAAGGREGGSRRRSRRAAFPAWLCVRGTTRESGATCGSEPVIRHRTAR